MLELIDTRPDVNVAVFEYQRLLGYPAGHTIEGRARELADWARRWYAEHGTPWIYARHSDGFEIVHGAVRIDGTEFSAGRLHEQFDAAQAHEAVLAAVGAGRQAEEYARHLWQEGKPDEYFFLETYGSAVVEHLITITGSRICGWAEKSGMVVLPHYSPGYSGWDISDQGKLLALIRPRNGPGLPGEIHALEFGMLRPKKSLLALFGITRHRDKARSLAELIPCENCSFSPCQFRRAPYHHSRPPIEDVRMLHGNRNGSDEAKPVVDSPLDQQAKYSVNLRALQKWSRERLRLKWLGDCSVEARFRYDGTTCSNMGRPLEYDYHVKLGRAEERYRIQEARCGPALGDTGHTLMCEYLNDAERLQNSIDNEKPLVGKPLNDVLTWQRQYSPSGCYCDAESRIHKWGLVFEVIHFALVQHEKARADRQVEAFQENSQIEHDKTL